MLRVGQLTVGADKLAHFNGIHGNVQWVPVGVLNYTFIFTGFKRVNGSVDCLDSGSQFLFIQVGGEFGFGSFIKRAQLLELLEESLMFLW